MALINGMNFTTSNLLTIPGEPYQVKRSFKERFFSLPWRPFKSEKTVIPQIPDPKVLIMGDTVVMHPAIFDAFQKELRLTPLCSGMFSDRRS